MAWLESCGQHPESRDHRKIEVISHGNEDIASLAMFLASDISGYITGQLISVSGGVYMP